MKNYKLYKALVAKTGLIVGLNQFGHVWIELRLNGALRGCYTLRQPMWKRMLKQDRAIQNHRRIEKQLISNLR